MEAEELPFRATKDIDMVLIVEALTSEFGEAFWKFVQDAGYHYINKGTGEAQFYRFSNPKSHEYPYMIELFSRKPEWMPPEVESRYAPVIIDEDISSLSAILLNDEYYGFLKKGTKVIDGLSILRAEHIIPFKAKAWLDLTNRKNMGDSIDSRDIKKHKNDIFRLSVLLTPNEGFHLTTEIENDMALFLEAMKKDNIDLKQLGITGTTKNDVVEALYAYYKIVESADDI